MLQVRQIERAVLATEPFGWAFVADLFAPHDAAALADTYPHDRFKTVQGNDGEKGYLYQARALIPMQPNALAQTDGMSDAWRRLATDLQSIAYREAMGRLTNLDLRQATIEVNLFHYSPGCWLGPHLDLKEKIVTHIFYFNDAWDVADGGCLAILRSRNMDDVVTHVPPLVGNSAVLVRSEKSWHAVSPVVDNCHKSRRSMTVTFYQPNAVSTMWPTRESDPPQNMLGHSQTQGHACSSGGGGGPRGPQWLHDCVIAP
jgi:SM-20-related protein